MKAEEIVRRVDELKKTRKKVMSNCFLSFLANPEKEWDVICSEESIVIQVIDNGVKRLYFYSIHFEDLAKLFEQCDEHSVIEILTKDASELREQLFGIGFTKLAVLKRVSTRNVASIFDSQAKVVSYENPEIGLVASAQNTPAVYDFLAAQFDSKISHLQTMQELRESIERGEIHICYDSEQKIQTLLQTIVEPKRYYVNQVINHADSQIIHAIMIKTLRKYVAQGGKYAYAWVEEDNIASLKFFEKYGLMPDGMLTCVYEYQK